MSLSFNGAEFAQPQVGGSTIKNAMDFFQMIGISWKVMVETQFFAQRSVLSCSGTPVNSSLIRCQEDTFPEKTTRYVFIATHGIELAKKVNRSQKS